MDSHDLVFRAWLSRSGIGMNVLYTRCLFEGHTCLVAFDYGSDNNVVSQRLVEKLQLPTTFHPNQAWIKFSTGQCVKEVLCDIAAWTLVIFFWDRHGFILKHSILMNVLFIWGIRDWYESHCTRADRIFFSFRVRTSYDDEKFCGQIRYSFENWVKKKVIRGESKRGRKESLFPMEATHKGWQNPLIQPRVLQSLKN